MTCDIVSPCCITQAHLEHNQQLVDKLQQQLSDALAQQQVRGGQCTTWYASSSFRLTSKCLGQCSPGHFKGH